ncbi:MAG: hypothetical protein AB1647_15010 [Pseudomonadota bacterium]
MMSVLLSFPDDEVKARRRGFARARADAARDERIVEGWRVRLADMIGTRPKGGGDTPAPDLARWITEAHAILQEVKAQPAQIRSEVHVAGLCLKLKGLVDEAEHARFLLVERVLDSGARRAPGAPVAALTANLVSDNLRFPACPPAAGDVKRPGGAGYLSGRFIARGLALAGGHGRAGGAPHKRGFLAALFHALTMRLSRRAVSEKGNRGFSGGEGKKNQTEGRSEVPTEGEQR